MKRTLVIQLAGVAVLAAALAATVVPTGRATPPARATAPALAAKRAEANRVLNEISAIDERLNTISEQFDGARVRLAALRTNLRNERRSFLQAKSQYHAAQQRVVKLLLWLYTSNHASSIDVILGATSVSQLLSLSDAESRIGKQTTAIASQARSAKELLALRVRTLESDRAAAQATVRELAGRRTQILQGLDERRRLLASVQAQVTKLEAQQRAEQARLAAEARARLAAAAVARAKAAAAAAAARERAQAEAARRAQRAAHTTVAAPAVTAQTTTATSTTSPTTTTDPATTQPAPTTPTTTAPAAPASTPPTSSAPGHPQAATIALQYLGVPYVWGGASPSGFDCSGLVTYVYAQLGITLPHFAASQWTYGVPVAESDLQPGDLVFFDALNHVGIYIGNGQFVAAPHTGSYVRIDSLSEPWYAAKYVGARRI